MSYRISTRHLLLTLITTTLILCLLGLIFIDSSSSVYAAHTRGSPHYFTWHQAAHCGLALLLASIAALLPSSVYYTLTPYLWFFSVILLAATLFSAGVKINGSQRWFMIGSLGFQPSECTKIATIFMTAWLLVRSSIDQKNRRRWYLYLLVMLGSSIAILLLQPDFGTAVLITVTVLVMIFAAGTSMRFLVGGGIALCLGALLAVWYAPYRMQRLVTFWDPWSDPHGRGYQIIQSLIAIGSGGISGVGVGNSAQKFFYLPMQHTDFIVSIIAEEGGFILIMLLTFLYGVLVWAGYALAARASSRFAHLVLTGCTTLLGGQALMNLMVVCGLIPTKGVGAPLVSYGGTALIVHVVMVGCMVGLARERA